MTSASFQNWVLAVRQTAHLETMAMEVGELE
jgi:hypothetical protein